MTLSSPHNNTTTSTEAHHAIAISDPLLTDIETAEILGCGRSTIWKWVNDAVIPKPMKIGGMSRWKRSDISMVIAHADTQREVAE